MAANDALTPRDSSSPSHGTPLFDYVEIFYNQERHQAALDHLSPSEFEVATSVA